MFDAFARVERDGWLGQRDLLLHQSFRHVTETAEPTVVDSDGGDQQEDGQLNSPDIIDTNLNDACLNSGIQNSQTSSNNTVQSKFAEAAQVHDPMGIRVAPGRPTRVAMLTQTIAPGVGSNAYVVVQGAWGGGVRGEYADTKKGNMKSDLRGP